MAKSLEDYKNALANLLPSGRAWNGKNHGVLSLLLKGIAEEFLRFGKRSEDFKKELNPNFCNEILSDWEKMLGLPDECTPQSYELSAQERRSSVLEKLSNRGGQSVQYIKNVCLSLGYPAEVVEYKPFRVGKSKMGEKIYSSSWSHWFKIIAPYSSKQVFRAGQSRMGDKLRTFRNDLLECTIKKVKPAHTRVFFEYTES